MKLKLGDKINRGFMLIVIVLGTIMIILGVYRGIKDYYGWKDNIHNPDNQPFVVEVAFNLDIPVDSVKQWQFDERYLRTDAVVIY